MSNIKIDELYNFLLKTIDTFDESDDGGDGFEIPHYDLYARDYLEFAENQLNAATTESLINCVSNLKRAMDCQIDTFLHTLSLDTIFDKRNLKFEKKLELIETIGIFNSKSLSKLNNIRNKMEHEYKIPDIKELDLYFDLVSAFISNIESVITVFIWNEKGFIYHNNENKRCSFQICLHRDNNPRVAAYWNKFSDDALVIEANINEYKAYAFYLSCLYLLSIKQCFVSNKYIKRQIQKTYNSIMKK